MGKRCTDATPTVEGLVARIRDIVNCCEVRYRATRDFATFAKLCTSMDTIADAQLAIDAFGLASSDDTVGHNYLMVYGLFQAYVIQQDAVRHLCDALREALDGEFYHDLADYPGLREVRALRIEIVGHPTSTGWENKGTASYHSISRPEMTADHLSLMSEYMDGERREFRRIVFAETTAKQAQGISAILQSVLQELQVWQEAEKAKHGASRLISVFPENYGDLFVEMQARIRCKSPRTNGESSVAAIREIMDEYEAELQRRGLAVEAYPGVQHAYEDLRHPISVLRAFFAQEPSRVDEAAAERAKVMAYFVKDRMAELAEMAREIDADYASTSGDGGEDGASAVPAASVVHDESDEVRTSRVKTANSPADVSPEPALASHFRALQYSVAKVQEGTYRETSQKFSELNLGLVRSRVDQILCLMRAHGLVDDEPSIVGEVTFVLSMLSDFYGTSGKVEAQDATVYAWYLGRLVDEMRALAVRAGLMADRIV